MDRSVFRAWDDRFIFVHRRFPTPTSTEMSAPLANLQSVASSVNAIGDVNPATQNWLLKYTYWTAHQMDDRKCW
jgi:hypothetical protein